jgi:two-component system, sensor histidine kinase PdtaS
VVPTLHELVRIHTDLDSADVSWLHLLLADWQIIADLSFADLVLWLPDSERPDGTIGGFWAGAHMRPTTGPTAYVDDVVGTFIPAGRRPLLDAAYTHGKLQRDGDPEWRDDVPVRSEAIPVRRRDRVIAVVGRHTNLVGVRTPSRLELAYLDTAADLTQMMASGHFPAPGQRSDHADSPRVGDGFVRVDPDGLVTYASPNALSVYRRFGLVGDLTGEVLADLTRRLVPARHRGDEESVSAALGGRLARETEIGTHEVALIVRAVPLRPHGQHTGALILVRDVSDLRRRDRELMTKDATIREIHHRVKNNLQTVAALLRLQGRRMESPEAREALDEAVRRVGSIAIVHETLSETADEQVDFDEISDRLTSLVIDFHGLAADVIVRSGSFGVLPSASATALSMVLTEVLQNAVEHGLAWRGLTEREPDQPPTAERDPTEPGAPPSRAGRIVIAPTRAGGQLHLTVEDDGCGLPEGFDVVTSQHLGLSIVRTLIESELSGSLTMGPGELDRGTRVSIRVPLD